MILAFVGKSSGKTTTAVNVSVALSQRPISRRSTRKRRVRLLNADPQASALEWDAQRTEPPVIEVVDHVSATIYQDLPSLMEGVDDLVIDCPAGTGRPTPFQDGRIRITRSAILAAMSARNGVVVVPFSPSPYDLWAGDDLMEVIEEAWTFDGAASHARSRAVLLFNRTAVTRKGGEGKPERVSRMERASRNRLGPAPLPLLETVIRDRVDYVQAPIRGLGITEFAPRSAAALEIEALTTELLTLAGEHK